MLVQATKPCFIGQYRDADSEPFEYDGPPASWLVPVDGSASGVEPVTATVDPLDHDADGKKGGAKPRPVRTPEEQAERDEVIKELKAKNIKYFAGATTEKLWEVLAAG